MARINLTKEAVALGIGVADELLESADRANSASTQPFQNFTDWARAGVMVGSGLALINNMMPEIAEPALYASSPLAAKSVTRLVQEILSKKGTDAGAMRVLPGGRRVVRSLPAGRSIDAVSRSGMMLEEDTLITTL